MVSMPKAEKRREAAEHADHEERLGLRAQRLPGLGVSSDEADDEAARRVDRQGAVGKPTAADSALHPSRHKIPQHRPQHTPDPHHQHNQARPPCQTRADCMTC